MSVFKQDWSLYVRDIHEYYEIRQALGLNLVAFYVGTSIEDCMRCCISRDISIAFKNPPTHKPSQSFEIQGVRKGELL